MQKMFGVEMEVPTGKLPGFYAQVIHKIGDGVKVFDRDQQLFILETENERNKLVDILDKYKMAGEQFILWLLPTAVDTDQIGDYGFVSASERPYLYDSLVSFFRLDIAKTSNDAQQDGWAAMEQMREHIVLSLSEETSGTLHIIDKNNVELINGLAKAYHISVEWI